METHLCFSDLGYKSGRFSKHFFPGSWSWWEPEPGLGYCFCLLPGDMMAGEGAPAVPPWKKRPTRSRCRMDRAVLVP